MIAVAEDGSAASERDIHCARHADGETAQAATKRRGVVGLDYQVDVIVLCTEVNNAEAVV